MQHPHVDFLFLSNWLYRITSLLLFLSSAPIYAQTTHPIFEHLTTQDGLSSDKVEAVLQDREGFYWIATQNGLNRYDGTTFTVFHQNENDSTSLTHNHCTALVEGLNGDIWVATYQGVSRYKKSDGHFEQIYLSHPTLNFELANRIYTLALDKKGNLWFTGNGLWKYDVDNHAIAFYQHLPGDSTSISDNGLITKMAYDSVRHGIWLSTGNALNFFDIDRNQCYHRNHNPLHWEVFNIAAGAEVTLDRHHRLWFRQEATQTLCAYDFTTAKIFNTGKKIKYGLKQISADEDNRIWLLYWLAATEIYNPLTGHIDSVFLKPFHRHSALSEKASSLYTDHNHQYWISSGKGISVYSEKKQFYSIYQPVIPGQGKDADPVRITALAQTDTDFIWIGTTAGLFTYQLATATIQKVDLHTSIEKINSLCADGDKVWATVFNQIISIRSTTLHVEEKYAALLGLFFISKGNENDLWAGMWNGGLYHLDPPSGKMDLYTMDSIPSSSLKSNALICGAPDGIDFWVGYNGGAGFSKYEQANGNWKHFHPKEKDPVNLSAGTVTVIVPERKNKLWLGTHGNGFFLFDESVSSFTHYQQEQGLKSNYINSMQQDGTGNLWISTADGMNYLDTLRNTIIPLDMGLVFSVNDFVANSTRGVDGKIYFFCNQEFVQIDASAFKPDTTYPQLVISHFKIFDQEKSLLPDGELMRLTHRQNFFSFFFSALKTRPDKKVQYAYRLKGFDQQWNETLQTIASYTNVSDGAYTFEVRVANEQGEWSEPQIQIPIFIQPPFWRTWWFITACLFFIGLTLYGIYRYRIRQLQKIFSVRTKISRDLHDDIGASLSSIHFYTSVAEKEVGADPAKAKVVLRQIGQRSRQIIENISDIVWANQTQAVEKSSLSGRIMNYGYDLLSPTNIECRYDIDPRVEKKMSNPEARRNVLLIIKEALNNMAKYSDAEKAEVVVSLNGTHLIIHVADDGKGFEIPFQSKGNGLSNMKSRAEALGGTLEIKSSPGTGTTVECRVPIPNISDV